MQSYDNTYKILSFNTTRGLNSIKIYVYYLDTCEYFIVDVDECKTLYPCSHFCMNTVGSYRCICADGFDLALDKKNCKVKGCKYYSFT